MSTPDICVSSNSLLAAFARVGPWLRRFFSRRAPPEAVDDLMQEVFLRAHASGIGSSPIEHLDHYLFRVASSVLADRARRRAARRYSLHGSLEEDDHPHEHLTPERILLDGEALSRVVSAIAELSPRTRDVFILHRFEDSSATTIAAQLGMTVSGVEKHIMKALRHLHARLHAD
ncbi:MAG TPA: sigma-70 family RNA polymerase sigma factor [Steroidobacteraceae bacterium]|jgi:RNA polymerase sigma-70 factor (ECF subfamily)|nr:sigma-70 family RNA polymerase sigma factor [Steroidobacteraceae bacterium]